MLKSGTSFGELPCKPYAMEVHGTTAKWGRLRIRPHIELIDRGTIPICERITVVVIKKEVSQLPRCHYNSADFQSRVDYP